MGGMGGIVANGSHDITIKDAHSRARSLFQDTANSANLLLDHNTHKNIFINCSRAGRPDLAEGGGLTVQNSLLQGGDADGIQIGTPGIGEGPEQRVRSDLRGWTERH